MRKRLMMVCFVLVAVLGPTSSLALAAGMPMSETKPTAAAEAAEKAPVKTWQEKYLAEGSPYRGLAVGALALIMLLVAKRFFTRRLRAYLKEHAYKPENAQKFMRTWNSVWSFVITVFVLIGLSGSLKFLGLSAGFLGMMLGWSLQAPVTGLAAWLMIVTKKPFRIGDRVIIGGTIGDVTDITLTHVILNQVGGTVSGEEKSGRGILVPNAILFGQIITNYTLEQKYMLDEVPVRVPFEADIDLAKTILLDAARKVTKDIIEQTKAEPFLRCEFYDAGVLIRLRYQAIPAERQRISSEIVDIIQHEFKANYPKVRFGYPHSVIQYRRDNDEDVPPELQA